MLRHLGEDDAASRIEAVIREFAQDPAAQTASTIEIGDAISGRL